MICKQDAQFILEALNKVPMSGFKAQQQNLNIAMKLQAIIDDESPQLEPVPEKPSKKAG